MGIKMLVIRQCVINEGDGGVHKDEGDLAEPRTDQDARFLAMSGCALYTDAKDDHTKKDETFTASKEDLALGEAKRRARMTEGRMPAKSAA